MTRRLITRQARLAGLFVFLLLACMPVDDVLAAAYSSRATLLRNRDFAEAFMDGIRSANKSIQLSFFLFKATASRGNMPRQVAEELIRARQRGVDVTVLLERQSGDRRSGKQDSLNDDNRQTAALLSRGGVKVYFDSPGVTTHTKVAVIDGRYVYLGSHNLSQSALRHNNELSVLLDSPELAREVREYIEGL
jgi:phosphatidylserine/phosphatidylglycerophosphate/cardiolipin synthase-like enzyme